MNTVCDPSGSPSRSGVVDSVSVVLEVELGGGKVGRFGGSGIKGGAQRRRVAGDGDDAGTVTAAGVGCLLTEHKGNVGLSWDHYLPWRV